MPFALGAVTLISLTMAIAMGVVTWRLVREERRRSAARLAVLTAELRRRGIAAPESHPSDETASRGDAARSSSDLFAFTVSPAGAWARHVVGPGLAAGIALVAVVSVVMLAGSREDAHTAPPREPLELLALEHDRQDETLTVSGTVRNPLDGAVDRNLSVEATAFDDTGTFVASARSTLTPREGLAPGASTSFVVALPAGRAHRYRVSFLSGDTTVPHLDRRAPVAAAPEVDDLDGAS